VNYFQKHKEGLVFTTLFHVALILILFYFQFYTPLPLPEEKGILVEFGTTDDGNGMQQPPKQNNPSQAKPIVSQPEVQPTQPKQTPPKATPSVPDASKEKIMTQDFEKTVAMEEAKKKEEERKTKAEADRKKKLEEEQKRKEQQELDKAREQDRQKILADQKRVRDSIERVNQAILAEQRRVAEQRRQDSIKAANDAAKAAAINSRTKNAFGGSGGTSNTSSTGQGQGATYAGGNQGSPDGTPGANQYGPGGGEGISFELSGRSARSLVKPAYSVNEDGVVVVSITVDRNGNVSKATAGARGTTSMNQSLWQAAQKAALATKFDSNTNAPAEQNGTIKYRFVLR
jgi:colicin import membrane protein